MKKTTILKNLSVFSLALLLVLSPAAAFADNDKNKDNNKSAKVEFKAEVKSKNKNNSCLRAYGHLIAPGWLKLNGSTTVNGNCWFPFGIGKKFRDETPKPADTVAPVISDIKSEAKLNKAVVSFETNEKAVATVFFGTTAGINIANSATLKVSSDDWEKDQEIKIPNLAANTKYYAVIQVKDKSGNVSTSAEFSFTTKAPVTEGDTVAPVITGVVASSNNSSVSVGWVTNEPSTTKVLYGTTSPVNVSSSATASVSSDDLKVNHFITVPNLSANTQYYLVIQSKDAAGNIQSSTEFGAKTGI